MYVLAVIKTKVNSDLQDQGFY